jgi:hypothetical protein
MSYGFRSVLAFFAGGGCKPKSIGQYAGPRSMLAYWLGGANFHYIPPPPIPPYIPVSDLTGGLPHDKRRLPGIIRDDGEILEFLQIWVPWQDIE